MKKSIFWLCLLCLTLPGQLAFGQKTPKPTKALKVALRPSQGPLASLTAELSDKQLNQLIVKLQRENAALERQIAAQQAAQEKAYSLARKAVFRALGPQLDAMTLSGTLFKTSYNGQEEIFGVVPMHVLRNEDHVPGTLSYKFTAGVFTDTTIKFIPAWVVQLSSSKTGDVALVKFRKQDEKLLSPLALNTQELTFPQQAYAQGFARNLLTRQTFQLMGTTSTGLLTAQIPAAYEGDRAGFCGSPVVNEQGTLQGIHVGSSYVPADPATEAFFNAFRLNVPKVPQGDIGYVVPASFVQNLVTAYHEPKSKPMVVRLAGHEITRLAINEYVARIELLDKDHRQLWTKNTNFKVSFSAVETILRLRNDIRYIKLEIGRTHWTKDDKGWHVQNTPGVSSVLYTLPENK